MIDENKNLAIREEKSTEKPLVSVCISVYNGERHLRKCLDSVISQDIPAPAEELSTIFTQVQHLAGIQILISFIKKGVVPSELSCLK